MISKSVVKLLNEQVVIESDSSQIYLAMAVWAEANGFRGTSGFMFTQAAEEREHMFKIMKFLLGIGEKTVVPGVKEPRADYKDIEEIFKASLKHEQFVTASINKIYSEALKNGDHAAASFLKWFIDEQVEEESTVKQILDVIRMAGKVSIYLADKEIGGLRAKK